MPLLSSVALNDRSSAEGSCLTNPFFAGVGHASPQSPGLSCSLAEAGGVAQVESPAGQMSSGSELEAVLHPQRGPGRDTPCPNPPLPFAGPQGAGEGVS